MKVLCVFATLVVAIGADYHDQIGIPLAARIKKYEDQLFAGVPEMESRLHGSSLVTDMLYPFAASLSLRLNNGERSFCGGSLVSARRVVTAAHCLKRVQKVVIRLGSLFTHYQGLVYPSTDFKMHPQYDSSSSINHDIAVVKLPDVAVFSDRIRAIDLPLTHDLAETTGEWVKTAGWGLTNDTQKRYALAQLREVDLQIMPEEICMNTYPDWYSAVGDTICTSADGERGICDGDYGGPLVVKRGSRAILVGVAALGDPNACLTAKPSIFTKVTSYVNFILSV